MLLNALFTILLSGLSLYSGIVVLLKYKDSASFFYFLFSVLLPIWFGLNIVAYSNMASKELMIVIFRLQYSISIIGFYSVIFFVAFFRNTKIFKKSKYYITSFFLTVFFLSNFSDLIIKSINYDSKTGFFYEIYGELYFIFVLLYLLIFPLFLFISYLKRSKLSNLDKTRLNYIISGFFLLIGIPLIIQVIVPFFSGNSLNIYGNTFISLFMLPFILGVLYSSTRYNFIPIKVYIYEFLSFSSAIALSILLSFFIKIVIIYFGFFTTNLDIKSFHFYEILFIIIVFYFLYKRIVSSYHFDSFSKTITQIYKKLPDLFDSNSLSLYIGSVFLHNHGILETKIKTKINDELNGFFIENKNIQFIINDLVFLDDLNKKIKGNMDLKQLFGDDFGLIFPIFSFNGTLRALMIVGKKRFSDSYGSNEIGELLKLVSLLQYHFEYGNAYRKLQDLSINLDKKVDEKTIEYNTLLAKQKEFIRYVGHEIKNPITNAIFLCDGLKDSAEKSDNIKQRKKISEDGSILYEELIKISELVKHIFSAEQFDLSKISLYKKQLNVRDFLYEEVKILESMHLSVDFELSFDDVGIGNIDEIQIRQAFQNLVTNAIKFANKENPRIYISLRKNKDKFFDFTIEDNGKGFNEIDADDVFDKYSTGGGSSVGLGMGLYLCKRIVELHGGVISAGNSKKLGGACFMISF